MNIQRLPDELQQLYSEQQAAIRHRLEEFSNISRSSWFYELCFCLCTPQSSAVHALQVQRVLEQEHFLMRGHDVLHVLRDPETYIRFHNTKHKRLHDARENTPQGAFRIGICRSQIVLLVTDHILSLNQEASLLDAHTGPHSHPTPTTPLVIQAVHKEAEAPAAGVSADPSERSRHSGEGPEPVQGPQGRQADTQTLQPGRPDHR